ncbi:sulfatase-like hydrolase/transferase [uncultured Polaribacter sp.]|uniref:sulfatase-like hydrolase/transferase n=1 Tax=uncultured Polaribacter sp. TaxID=174711 RepID=UPI0026161B6D|nr:sulfatase-like hydrolase/transferase [uncultured Polaribacter sp.]
MGQTATKKNNPNIVLIMSDDQGWGETGYNGHPVLKTPILDEMARTGLNMSRFYAASPVCTPTRVSCMTGRHANRSGAFSWNWSTRPEEITISQLLKNFGYSTGHFGKWHIGAIKEGSPVSPKALGFDENVSHDNFFEMNPLLSKNGGEPQVYEGEGSEVIVAEAMKFIEQSKKDGKPFFVVIWFGSPHAPYSGTEEDVKLYEQYGNTISRRFAEITAMDRAIGQFRDKLTQLGERSNTLIWFNSDNGIPKSTEFTQKEREYYYNGSFRGYKGDLTEGGLRVPAIIEWPAVIDSPIESNYPCVTSDILPTILEILKIDVPVERPMDGISILPVINGEKITVRNKPIGSWVYPFKNELINEPWIKNSALNNMITFTANNKDPEAKNEFGNKRNFVNYKHPEVLKEPFFGRATWIDNNYKLIVYNNRKRELYNLRTDIGEVYDISKANNNILERMSQELKEWQVSVENSLAGKDYKN